ncbi:MAG: 50S ribosomal protein L32 [Armatimonadetes bacterium]|nr:MAG: 50S ribosomal protein L32 [Armatimonadota bacterium]MCE7899776.1 50S ribosomal protein L32 [Armatimonadetes bacterium ATM1]MDL1929048.1 50S ribosomal protein L32 [Fimbriimonadia bacterium ATM]MBC6970371.1 50S ribosomal protein L32 [Armatimonadota bacterium]MBL1149349.1 50S ribosomal protein L32 [Armatimonadota bacterium]
MPNPKRKHSHARSAKRRGTWRTEMPELVPNKQQGGSPFVLPHTATPDGYYKGRRLPGYKDRTR